MRLKLLIADDNCSVLGLCLESILRQHGQFDIVLSDTPEKCLLELGSQVFDIVLLDLSFSHGNKEGLDLIPQVRRLAPNAELIMLTSFDDPETIGRCMASGAHDYISKNHLDSFSEMSGRIGSALARRQNRFADGESGIALAKRSGASFTSQAMREVYSQVARVRNQGRMHVLITGPTGSGKELVAQAIARQEEGAPFFPVNSSCFGKDLLESELFGHERGSFTGADRLKQGLFELANGGDIFFDEVATLAPEHQVKLLRVLQSGEFYRAGGTKLLTTSARVIAATNEDLEALVRQGKFREDLLQRLQRYHIRLPALRERKEDIPVIVDSIIRLSKKPNVKISDDCLKVLIAHNWPRNVRELEDSVTAMIMNSDGKSLTVGDLPRKFFDRPESDMGGLLPSISDKYGFTHQIKWGTEFFKAQSQFAARYIEAEARRMKPPVTIKKLAKVLGMPRSTLGKRLLEFQIDLRGE